jgi:hypothetical protein
MKKLVTLLLAAGMVLGSFAGAQAVDWKVRGAWHVDFGVFDGLSFSKHTTAAATGARQANRKKQYGDGKGNDTFDAGQRVDLWLDAVASENLSGSLRLEIPGNGQASIWGSGNNGAATNRNGSIGQRGNVVGVRNAYLDWIVPQTALKIRMGIQNIATPGFAFGTSVFFQDVAGVVASYKFNDNASLTAFWARPYNDNFAGVTSVVNTRTAGRYQPASALDNTDVFGLIVPLSFDGFKVTPWTMFAAIGPNTFRDGNDFFLGNTGASRFNQVRGGMAPAYWQSNNRRATSLRGPSEYGTAWWGGLTLDITAADPFRFAFDAVYGSVNWPGAGYLQRQGWFLAALAEYKLDWGVPGIYAWWGSGDDSNPRNGSQRMPVLENNGNNAAFSTFGLRGNASNGGMNDYSILGDQFHAGSWGIGVKIRDMSFLEDLKHTARVNFFGGTNAPANAKYMLGKRVTGTALALRDFNGGTIAGSTAGNAASATPVYLTTLDTGIELNFDTNYKIYENLELVLELGYIHLWLDQGSSMWGAGRGQRGVSTTDAVKAFMSFRYTF